MAVITLLAMTSCSTISQMPPTALGGAASSADSTDQGDASRPGAWHTFGGYTDSDGAEHAVSGRVRAVPTNLLEFETYSPSSPSLARASRRFVVPRDSVRALGIRRIERGKTVLAVGVGTVAAAILLIAVIAATNPLVFVVNAH